MMDVYMTVALAAVFALFYAFVQWCGHVVDEQGGMSDGGSPCGNVTPVSVSGLCFDSSGEILKKGAV